MELSAVETSLDGINTKFEKFRYRESLLGEAAGEKAQFYSGMSFLALCDLHIIDADFSS